MSEDIYQKLLNGERVNIRSEEFAPVVKYISWANIMCHRINMTEPDFAVLHKMYDELFERHIPDSVILVPDLHIYFPRHITFGERIFINHNLTAMAAGGIEIGDDCFIGPNTSLITDNHEFLNLTYLHPKRIRIGKRVWIGANSLILPGITIEDDAVVAGGSVVTHDVKSKTVVGGNPAKVIKTLD